MKKIYAFFVAVLCVFESFAQVPTSGQVAYYPLDNNANDASGAGRNGTASNVSYVLDRFDQPSKAALFNATNSSVVVSNWNILSGNAARTISIWFKAVGQTSSQYMLSWGANTTNQSSVIGNFYGTGNSGFGFIGFVTGLLENFSGTCPYFDNQWHNVIFTHDGTTSRLFVDGVQKTTNTSTYATGTSNLFIGNYYGVGSYFNGSLDDIRIYNRALSATEVTQLYTAELPVSTNDLITIGSTRFLHTVGTDNLAMGESAGIAISSGQKNLFVGENTGKLNTQGSYNTFIGQEAGAKNTLGGTNSFIGNFSGFNNSIGTNNTFLGYYSGFRNSTKSYNTFIGVGAGFQVDGEKNTNIGFEAGVLTENNENTFLGYRAGYDNLTGGFNTFIGSQSRGKTNSITRSTAIGYNAVVGIDDAIVLGDTTNPNIKVGIGIGSPRYRLDVKGVVNMSVGFNAPALKINGEEFLATNGNGEFVLSSFRLKYKHDSDWSDRVFDEQYQLPPLEDVIRFTKSHKHLPNIPSAETVLKDGIDIKEQFSKQLEKIEELYLYLDNLRRENELLRKRIEKLETKSSGN
jgi:trimeric autotransporter adhesin